MRTFSWVGEPSSSTLSEPRRLGMVPLSTTVTLELATLWPMRPAKAEVFLAVEVGFESVADGFVKQDSGPAGAEDDFHVSSGRGDGVELQDRLARGFVSEVLGGLVALEEVELERAASAEVPLGGLFAVFGDDEDIEAGEGLGIGGEGSVGGGDEDAAEFVGVAGADLDDAGIEGAGGFVGAHD
jgi:hypothetical protein